MIEQAKENHSKLNDSVEYYKFFYNQFDSDQAYLRIESLFFRVTIKKYYAKVQEILNFEDYFEQIYALDKGIMYSKLVDFQFIDNKRRYGYVYFKGIGNNTHLHFEFFYYNSTESSIKNLKSLSVEGQANTFKDVPFDVNNNSTNNTNNESKGFETF